MARRIKELPVFIVMILISIIFTYFGIKGNMWYAGVIMFIILLPIEVIITNYILIENID